MNESTEAGDHQDAQRADVIIVGAGLSGLVAALRLRDAGLNVQVLEAGAAPGGVLASVRRDGFLFERGPNTALDGSGLMQALVVRLGLQDQLCWARPEADKRYLVRGGRMLALPASPWSFVGTPLFSAAAKWGLLAAPWRRAAEPGQEETVAAFVRRRLGPEFLDYAIDPLVGGIYAADPERLSVQACFPPLHALEQRWCALRRGRWGGQARPPVPDADTGPRPPREQRRSFSFKGGMQAFTDALAAAVGTVALDTRVEAIQRHADGWSTVHAQGPQGRCAWQARQLVLAVPAHVAAGLLRPHAADAAQALDGIAYAPVATVASAYARQDIVHPLDGFGCLMPGVEKRRTLGVLFSSSMFDGRAPAGAALLTSFIGGWRNPEHLQLPDEGIAALARAEHDALLGLRGEPLWQAVSRWPQAIPQYEPGHLGRVARADAAARDWPGLHLCGSWKEGLSVAQCVRNGHRLGLAVAAALRQPV